MEVQEAERRQLPLPVVAAPARSHPRARRLASAGAAVAPTAQGRPRIAGWDYPVRVATKGLLLTAILALGIVLAGYAGVLPLLPAAPPRMVVTGGALHASIAPAAYCWLSPGAGGCTDGGASAGQTPSAPLVAGPSQAIAVRFSYPAPTTCTASGSNAASVSVSLKVAPEQTNAMNSGFRLLSPAAAGTYAITIACDWNPHRSLRWLRGFGHASYPFTLKVAGG
jgi:hypothetical protein